MSGRVQWEAQINSNVKQLLADTLKLRGELDGIKKGNYGIRLDINEQKLKNIISNLDKMLSSLGKGTGDFKEFENLSKQLNSIVSEVQSLNKAFGNINDAGVSKLLSSIKNIDKSLTNLSEHIGIVRKEFGNIGENSNNISQINKTKKATERLTDATKELGKAQKNLGNKTNISSAQSSSANSNSSIKEENKNFNDISSSAKAAASSKEKFTKANKEVKKSADSSNASIKREEQYLSSLSEDISKYYNKLNNFSIKPKDGQRFPEYQQNLNSLSSYIKKLEEVRDSLSKKTINNKDIDENKVEKLKKQIEDTISVISKMPASEKGFLPLSADKSLEKINSLLKQNPGLSKQAKSQMQAFYNEIISGNPSRPLNEILDSVYKIVQAERQAGREGKRFIDIIKDKAWFGWAAQVAGMFSFYDVINGFRTCITTIHEFDTALTEMRKVSDESVKSLKNYQKESFSTANSIGSTSLALQNATADWMRLGESLDEAKKSAKDATILLNVSEFEDINAATESLVAMSQAYDELEKIEIIDVLDNIGNNYSIATDELSIALQDSAAVLKTQGNDLNQAVALLTTGNAITQDASKTAGGVRTISLRLAGKLMMPEYTVMYRNFLFQ